MCLFSWGPTLASGLHEPGSMRTSMLRPILLALSSLAFAACAASPADELGGSGGGGGGKADADEVSACPVDGDADQILAAISNGGSCYTAAGIAEACAWGASIDVQFVSAAAEVCERGFGAMPASDQATYAELLERCVVKYADDDLGTLYQSMMMFCQLEVTKLYNQLYPEPETSEPAVPYTASCPVDGADAAAIEAAIAAAPSCGLAADVAEACAWGSSIDVQFSAIASEACSGSFADMTEADAALHGSLIEACTALYADEEGTLYRAMTAHCQLQVDVVFDAILSPVE